MYQPSCFPFATRMRKRYPALPLRYPTPSGLGLNVDSISKVHLAWSPPFSTIRTLSVSPVGSIAKNLPLPSLTVGALMRHLVRTRPSSFAGNEDPDSIR